MFTISYNITANLLAFTASVRMFCSSANFSPKLNKEITPETDSVGIRSNIYYWENKNLKSNLKKKSQMQITVVFHPIEVILTCIFFN